MIQDRRMSRLENITPPYFIGCGQLFPPIKSDRHDIAKSPEIGVKHQQSIDQSINRKRGHKCKEKTLVINLF